MIIATNTYGYDNAGVRINHAYDTGGPKTVTWGYDNAYRLTSEERRNPAGVLYRETHTYDEAGNRTVYQTAAATLTTYTYDAANQLETAVQGSARTTYTYDANGNLTVENASGVLTTNTWDDENRLTQVERT